MLGHFDPHLFVNLLIYDKSVWTYYTFTFGFLLLTTATLGKGTICIRFQFYIYSYGFPHLFLLLVSGDALLWSGCVSVMTHMLWRQRRDGGFITGCFWFSRHCLPASIFFFPNAGKLESHASRSAVLGQCHVTAVCCETRVAAGSRDGACLAFFFFFFLVSKSPPSKVGEEEVWWGGGGDRVS